MTTSQARNNLTQAAPDGYMRFEDAMKETLLKPEELKRLISEGEVRAIRDEKGGPLPRAEDVEKFVLASLGGEYEVETVQEKPDGVLLTLDLDQATGPGPTLVEEDLPSLDTEVA